MSYTPGFSEDGKTFTDSYGDVFQVNQPNEDGHTVATPKLTGRNVTEFMRFPTAEDTGKREN